MRNKAFHVMIATISVLVTMLVMIVCKDLFAKIKVGSSIKMPSFSGCNGKYEITKLDWLVINAQINARFEYDPDNKIGVEIAGNNSKSTIYIYGIYRSGCDMDLLREYMNLTRKNIESNAKQHGWDSWLKIEESFYPLKN